MRLTSTAFCLLAILASFVFVSTAPTKGSPPQSPKKSPKSLSSHPGSPSPESGTGYSHVQLVVYKDAADQRMQLFPVHWALFIPSTQNANTGKRFHVIGDSNAGFEHQFDDWNAEGSARKKHFLSLGDIKAGHSAADIERVANSVPAPEKSTRSASEVCIIESSLILKTDHSA